MRPLPFLLLCSITALSLSASTPHPPNILVIVADDLGYSDLGCYGGEVSTPNLDRLAREGLRLPRFYNGGMCVVTRASLLTGQWWPRALPGFREAPLVSEHLQREGYRTALIGKWHLPGHPLDRGFDHFYGFLKGFANHFKDENLLDRQPVTDSAPDYYSSDAFSDRAIAFINGEAAVPATPDQPFFLYLSYQAPHNPLQAPREDIMKYRGRYLEGWQAIREARFARQKQLGLVSPEARLPDYPQNLPDWDTLTAAQRDLEDLRMATYAAMVDRMDQGIGRVLDALDARGELDRTLVLFMSDNGPDSFSVMDAVMLGRGKLPGEPDSNYQPGTGWAYASVTPLRLYKISQHAGGTTTGAIAWWPGHTGQPGRISATPVHVVDVLPTLLEIAKTDQNRPAVAGESFVPLLQGTDWHRTGPLYFQFRDNRAIRTEEWTLVEVDGAGWELFSTRTDAFENHNLAAHHPEVVATLAARWLDWWRTENQSPGYEPISTQTSPHYKPQGDRGSGKPYVPSAMPDHLTDRFPLPGSNRR